MEIIFFLIDLPKKIAVFIIKGYQKTVSPDHGIIKKAFPYGCCRYTPTCSEYGLAAIEKYGVIKGGIKTIWRLLRCNPFSKGGYDPLK